VILCGGLAAPAAADSYTVRNLEDSGGGSLRAALDDADDGDTILFAGDLRGELRLSDPLDVRDAVTIKGPGADQLTIRAGEDGSAIDVEADTLISGLTISGGESGIDLMRGQLTLVESAVRGAVGPGIEVGDKATLILSRSLIAENGGAGIENGDGTSRCINSTISGNGGGGIVNGDGEVDLANCTVASNRGPGVNAGEGQVRLRNSLLAENSPACAGTVVSNGHNLADDASCGLRAAGDQDSADPRLGVLYGNGGRTATQAPGASSPVIDAGDPDGCADPAGGLLRVDQRGERRPSGARCDIGAVEVQAAVSAGGGRTVVNRILALVDGDPITLYEVKDFAASDVRLREAGTAADPRAILDVLITKR
jgi:hypothetical protein